jgi:predicted enzyme related to lactoylglutathione lyase
MRMAAVWYPVRDWQEARHFYGEVLELTEARANEEAGWVAYSTGGPPLFIVRRPELAGLPGGPVVTFDHDDLETLRDRIAAAGCRVDDELQLSGNLLIMTFYDPDGNRLEAAMVAG